MPFNLMGLFASNSAANEWCARTVLAASTRPTATSPPSMYARMSSSCYRALLPAGTPTVFQGSPTRPRSRARERPASHRHCTTLRPVVLAEMNRQRLAADPAHRPAARPWPRVGARIFDGHFVAHRVQIDARELLDQAQLLGVRQPAVGEPEVLVEPAGVGHERAALPFSHRPAIVQGVIVISTDLAHVSTAVGVDDAVVAVAAAHQHEHALSGAVLDELDAVALLELTGPARRLAVQERRVVLQETALAVRVETERPWLHRRHLRRVRHVL